MILSLVSHLEDENNSANRKDEVTGGNVSLFVVDALTEFINLGKVRFYLRKK